MKKMVLLEKAGTELNDEKAIAAVNEFEEAVKSPDGINNNNYYRRVLEVMKYLLEKTGLVH